MSESPQASADRHGEGLQSVSFGEIRLQPGTRIQLVLSRQGGEQAHFTTVIGYQRDEYLIVKLPVRNRAVVPIEADESVRIRLFSGVHLYDFRATVLRVFRAPVNYVHLSFPDDIRATPIRMAPRVRADLPARVTLGDGQQIEALIADISAHGAQIQAVAPQAIAADGDRLRMSFTLRVGVEEREHEVTVEGAVRKLKASAGGDESLQSYGIQFGDLDDADSLSLQNFILRRIIEDQDSIV